MDSSNQQTNPQPEQQPTVLQTPQESQQTQAAPVVSAPPKIESSNSSSSNILVWLIVGLIVLILAAGGIYIYLNRQEARPVQTEAPQTQVKEDSLESELNTIDVESEGNDFVAVDQDLQSL